MGKHRRIANGQWSREVRARHAEDRLPPPVLDQPRRLQIRADHIQPSKPRLEKILKVKTDFFTALSTWSKIGGAWSCVQADTVIAWMKGSNPEDVARELIKMGADYQFLDPNVMGPSHGAV